MAELEKNVTKSAQNDVAAETKAEEKPVEINKENEKKEEVKPVAKRGTVKRTTVKKTGAEKKEAAKRTPAEKKETAKRTTAAKKETAKRTRTAAAKKEPVAKRPYTTRRPSKVEITLELAGNSHTQESLVQSAKDVWVYDLGRNLKDFKSLELYIKPEDKAVYYVVNGEVTGSFAL